jgi:hypothetical protein
VAASIPQPFTAYLPPCLEALAREGAAFGRQDAKICLGCIALHYRIEAQKSQPPISDDDYDLLPMLRHINKLSHEPLSDQELEQIDVEVRCSKRSKLTCRELKRSETLRNCCVPEDCALGGNSESGSEIQKLANRIMCRGDVLKFLVIQAQKNHIGDKDVLLHLLASIACTNSLTSAGIQPELNGEKGKGKTDAVRAVFHLVPDRWKLSASISAKALYYYKDLLPGSVIFSDDVQWSEDLISTVKRSMGSFQEPQTHFTLDANRNPLPHVMPPRLVWWLSSVESVADDQLKDRQYSLDIDEGKEHAAEVSDFLRCSRSEKRIRFSVDRGIEIAREILLQIKEHEPFKVVIDCAKFADWKVKEDHRTQNKFWDLVEAFAVLRFKQRHIDEEGWLHATKEDFETAKTIFMRRKVNHATHLTNAQTKIVKSVIALQREPDGATQATIAKDLGISQQAVSKGLKAIIANTRYLISRPGVHGETFYECTVSSLEVCYSEGALVSLPDDYQDPPYNPLQPSYNHDTTKFTTIETNNGKPNHIDIQPNPEKCSKDGCNLSGCTSEPYHAQKNGCKVVNSPLAIDQPGCEEVVSGCKEVVTDGCTTDTTVLRFLTPVSAFTGVDLREYGPFQPEDVATVPTIHATNLIASGYAREIMVPPPSRAISIKEQNAAREEHFANLAAKYTKDTAQKEAEA